MASLIQLRRDLSTVWTSVNPILADGELGLEIDTAQIKVGNGVDAWNDLVYYLTGPTGAAGGSYTHVQSVPSSTWSITHSLGYMPNITVIDSAGTQVIGDITYINTNSLTVTFAGAFSGNAYLS